MAPPEDPMRHAPGRAIRPAPVSGDVVGRERRVRRDEDDEFDEGPSADDIERFGDVTRTCPECGKEVYDDAAKCYHCGHVFDARDQRGAPVWAVVVAVLIVVAFAFVLIGRGRIF